MLDLLRDFGLDDFYLELSTRPDGKAVGTDEDWEEATEALAPGGRSPWTSSSCSTKAAAPSTGPKISVQARDAIGRTWQMSTIQLDFQLPQRFDLEYVGADNARHRPIMIHRALFGSVERFFAVLARALRRRLPDVARRRCRCGCCPCATTTRLRAARSRTRSLAAGRAGRRRTTADEPLGARIRRAKLEKLPYVLVVGDTTSPRVPSA